MKRRWLIVPEAALWVLGLSCCAALLIFHERASAAREASLHLFPAVTAVSAQASEATEAASPRAASAPAEGEVIGRLDIKAVGLSVPIVAGYDPDSLRKGVGHIQGTATPGGLGNMALAGHRDTFLRPLRRIRLGDTMAVYTAEGRYDYHVDSTEIVKPEQVSVLVIRDRPEMTLITCYPFQYVGSAPLRFIVHAHLESVDAVQDANDGPGTIQPAR